MLRICPDYLVASQVTLFQSRQYCRLRPKSLSNFSCAWRVDFWPNRLKVSFFPLVRSILAGACVETRSWLSGCEPWFAGRQHGVGWVDLAGRHAMLLRRSTYRRIVFTRLHGMGMTHGNMEARVNDCEDPFRFSLRFASQIYPRCGDFRDSTNAFCLWFGISESTGNEHMSRYLDYC
jgi:hypothetical protein